MFQFLMRHQADLPPACHYEITVSSNLDGVVDQVWKWSGYDTYAFNHDLALQHLSLVHMTCALMLSGYVKRPTSTLTVQNIKIPLPVLLSSAPHVWIISSK